MTITAQSITKTFHSAGMDIPDDEMAARMAENMAYSGYSESDFQQVMQATQRAMAATNGMACNKN